MVERVRTIFGGLEMQAFNPFFQHVDQSPTCDCSPIMIPHHQCERASSGTTRSSTRKPTSACPRLLPSPRRSVQNSARVKSRKLQDFSAKNKCSSYVFDHVEEMNERNGVQRGHQIKSNQKQAITRWYLQSSLKSAMHDTTHF